MVDKHGRLITDDGRAQSHCGGGRWTEGGTHCARRRLCLWSVLYGCSKGIPCALISTSLGKKLSLSMSSHLLSAEMKGWEVSGATVGSAIWKSGSDLSC